MVTLKDIARKTGVSIRTVSRALKDDGYVKEDVKSRILAVAKELNYTPNIMARSLRTNKSYEVCVLTWSVDELHMKKIVALENELRKHGYLLNLMIDSPDSSDERKNKMIEDIIRRRPAGVVTLPAYVDHDKTALERFVAAGVLCVAIDPRHEHKERVDISRDSGAYDAVGFLLEKYGEDVAYLGIESEGHNITRLAGYRRALKEHNISKGEEHNFTGNSIADSNEAVSFVRQQYSRTKFAFSDITTQYAAGIEAAELIKENCPRAALVFSDIMCMGLLYGLMGSGISIPRDLAIIGFDDRSCATLCCPPLTTIAQPNEQAGIAAATILLAIIADKDCSETDITVRTQLIKRLSA